MQALVEAALAAPSAMNLQPWQLIVITNKALIDALDDEAMSIIAKEEDQSRYNRIMERGGKIFYNAPCMFIVLKEESSKWGDMDAGIMTQNIALAATSLGLDNVICAMAQIPFMGDNAKEYKEQLKWPKGYDFGMAVLIGRGNATKPPHELDMSKVIKIT